MRVASAASRRSRKPTVVIDPGHGGVDPGALGRNGLEEKAVVLDIAEHCATALALRSGASVHLTRREDVFLSLEERVAIARRHQADLFVSIHADSAPTPAARGLSVYTLSGDASDKLAASLARHENAVDAAYGVKLRQFDDAVASILFDLARRETLNLSRAVQRRLIGDLASRMRLLDNPARHADFAVLRSAAIPAVLVETGFLSNRADELELRSGRYRRKIGATLATSLSDALSVVLTS
ncbi:N-acetylmuramoyl-L-alanine amidase family protein [Tistlia consotensis]|nr:N-acetylmuramoyl-L-alanine amidase [Tistlia consotensis]